MKPYTSAIALVVLSLGTIACVVFGVSSCSPAPRTEPAPAVQVIEPERFIQGQIVYWKLTGERVQVVAASDSILRGGLMIYVRLPDGRIRSFRPWELSSREGL